MNDTEEPTHQSGSIIDLAIVSQGAFLPGATSRVDDSLATGNDHATITVAVPLRGQAKGDDQKAGRFNIRQVEPTRFRNACLREAAAMRFSIPSRPADPDKRAEYIESLAEGLVHAFTRVLEDSAPQ